MSPLLLLFFLGYAGASPISLLTNLTLRVPAETDSSIDLNYMVTGQNLTYRVEGQYTDASGRPVQAALPSVAQRMQLLARVPKLEGVMNANFSQVVEDAERGNLIYTIDDSSVSTWDIANISAPVMKATSPPFYRGDPITAIGQFAAGGRALVIMLTAKALQVTIGVADTTAITKTTMVGSATRQFDLPDAFRSAQFVQTASSMLAVVATASTVEVYSLSLSLSQRVAFVYSITNSDLSADSMSPVFASISGDQGVFCDRKIGVVVFNATALLEPIPQYQTIVTDDSPLGSGDILTCAYFDYYLGVTTTGGVWIYDIIANSLFPVNQYSRYLHENEDFALAGALGLTIPGYSAQYELSSFPDGSNVTTFRVYEDYFSDLQHVVICDEWNYNLFGTDVLLNPTPAFLTYSLPPNNFLIFNSYSALYVFSLAAKTVLNMQAHLQSAFTFNGSLEISNDETLQQWSSWPLYITGLDSEAATIYGQRGMLPGQYPRPASLSGLVEPESSGYSSFYLPISSYLSGHNVSYSVSKAMDADITVELPPLSSFVDDFLFPDASLSTTIVQLRNRMAVVHDNEVVVFDLSAAPTPVCTLPPSVSDSTLYNIATLECDSHLLLLLESGLVDPSQTYNVTWDFFYVEDIPALAFSAKFLSASPSLSLTAAGCSVFSLQGSAVETYEVNSTTWTLVSRAEVTGNLDCAPANPISIVLSADAQTLFFYDLTLGLIATDVSDLTQTTFSCQVVAGTVLAPNPSIRLEASQNYLYLLTPQAGALPQLVQYDISDLSDIEQTLYYPSFGDCTYTDVAASELVLAVMCFLGPQSNILIFDPQAMSYESLYVGIPANSGSVYAYMAPDNTQYVLTYDGLQVKRYALLQRGSDWNPVSPLIQSDDESISVWLKLDFPTTESPRLVYQTSLTVTATSGLSGRSSAVVVNVTMENPGTFIYVEFSDQISRLTDGGEFSVGNQSVSVGVPTLVFSGGDIQYELLYSDNLSYSILPTDSCKPSTDPCMLGKHFLTQKLDSYLVTALTQTSDGLLAVGNNSLLTLQQNGEWEVTKVAQLQLPCADCFCDTLQSLSASLLLVCAGESEQIVAVLDPANPANASVLSIDYEPEFVVSTYVPSLDVWLVFLADLFDVNVLKVVPETDGHFSLVPFATINAVRLGLKSMYPQALAVRSDGSVYLSDSSGNIHVVDFDANGTVTLNSTHALCNVVALQPSVDSLRLFALCSSGELFTLKAATFSVLMAVPPLSQAESVTIYNELVVDPQENWAAFPVFDSLHYTVRVLDLTPTTVHSEIYTSIGAGPVGLGSGDFFGALALLYVDEWRLDLAVLQYFRDFVPPLSFYRVLPAPNVTFYPGELHSETMLLHAYNAYSEFWSEAFTVNYLGIEKPVDDDSPEALSHSDFNHWYVWLLLSLGAFVLSAGGAWLASRFLCRKNDRDEALMSLAEVSKTGE